jgi:proteasome accessory factor B
VAEASWHPTQTVERASDGSLTWRATVSGTIEIRSWILGWGDEVEVLAPGSLREEVAAVLGRAAARYGTIEGPAAGRSGRARTGRSRVP